MTAPFLHLPAASCWTGEVAAWCPFPQPATATATAAAAASLPTLKTSSRGVWLRSDGGGVVAIAVGGCGAVAPPPQLSITLRGSSQQLVRSDLTPRSFAYRLLCRQHGAAPAAMAGSNGSVLLLSLAAPIAASPTTPRALQKRQLQQHSSSRGACRTYAVRFDTPQAGTECGALLQAIQRGRLRVQQQQQQQPPRRQPTQAQAAAAASQQQQKQQQQQDDDPGSSVERCLDWGDAHQLEEAVQAVLLDPGFEAYVDAWDAAVARAETLLAAQVGDPL